MFLEQKEFIRIVRARMAYWELLAMEIVKAIGYYISAVLITTAPYRDMLSLGVGLAIFITVLRMVFYRFMRWSLGYETRMDKSMAFFPIYFGKTTFWLSIGFLLGIFLPKETFGLTEFFLTYGVIRVLVVGWGLVKPEYIWGGQKLHRKGSYQSFLFSLERFKSTLVYEIIRF